MGDIVHPMKLGSVLRHWRENKVLTIEEAAKLIGINKSSLHRLEQGHDIDGRNLAKVLTWLLNIE
jgi:transcriptional regulator with XRE-family HTH domain